MNWIHISIHSVHVDCTRIFPEALLLSEMHLPTAHQHTPYQYVRNTKYIPTVQPHLIHFARAITLAWVGLLGSLWYILVEEDLKFFLRYHGSMWVDGKVVKNQVKNWKIAFLAFFVHLVKCPNHHNKVPFFYFFPFMGMREIDTDTIGYHELGILDISQTVC